MYHFTKLAIELNEEDESVAPTDSRRRPDQRLMEQGAWDESNKVKSEVEERQRIVRKKREAEAEAAMAQGMLQFQKRRTTHDEVAVLGLAYPEYAPIWFEKTQDEFTGSVIHLFKNEYWNCKDKGDWARCPSIF